MSQIIDFTTARGVPLEDAVSLENPGASLPELPGKRDVAASAEPANPEVQEKLREALNAHLCTEEQLLLIEFSADSSMTADIAPNQSIQKKAELTEILRKLRKRPEASSDPDETHEKSNVIDADFSNPRSRPRSGRPERNVPHATSAHEADLSKHHFKLNLVRPRTEEKSLNTAV